MLKAFGPRRPSLFIDVNQSQIGRSPRQFRKAGIRHNLADERLAQIASGREELLVERRRLRAVFDGLLAERYALIHGLQQTGRSSRSGREQNSKLLR
jgi:hypothetical protein